MTDYMYTIINKNEKEKEEDYIYNGTRKLDFHLHAYPMSLFVNSRARAIISQTYV